MTKVLFSNSRRGNWPQLCDSLTQLWPSCFSSTSDHRVRNVKIKRRTSYIQQLTSSQVRLYECMIWHLFKDVYPDQWARDPDLLRSGVTLGSLGLYLVKTCVCLLSLTASIYSLISRSLFSTRFLSSALASAFFAWCYNSAHSDWYLMGFVSVVFVQHFGRRESLFLYKCEEWSLYCCFSLDFILFVTMTKDSREIIKSLWSFHSCLHPQKSIIFGMWEVTEGGEAAWPSVWGVSVCQISGKSSLEYKYMSLVDIEHESETAWRHWEQIFTMANHKGKWTSAADCSYYC